MEVAVAAGRGLVAAPPLGSCRSSSQSSSWLPCSTSNSSSSSGRWCHGGLSAARAKNCLARSPGSFERSGSCESGSVSLVRWRFERSACWKLGSTASQRGVGGRIRSVAALGGATGWGKRCVEERGESSSLAKRRVARIVRRSSSGQASDSKADDAVQGLQGKAEESKAASGEAVDAVKGKGEEIKEAGVEESEGTAKKSVEVMKDTTEKLKAEAEKAQAKLAAAVEETAALGKSNLNSLTENAPDPIKGVAETAADAHLKENKKPGSKIHDFCLGIPYGALLFVGGLVLFIITGNTAAIRFGVILGGLLLFLSVKSLNVWKEGKSSVRQIQGQGVIALVLFVKDTRKYLATGAVYPWALLALASGAMLAFYLYVYFSGGNPPKKEEAPKKTEASELTWA